MEMLSERLDIPLHAVTKRGGDSWIVIPMTPNAETGAEVDRARDADGDTGPGSCSDE
jgi:hypothetical protein